MPDNHVGVNTGIGVGSTVGNAVGSGVQAGATAGGSAAITASTISQMQDIMQATNAINVEMAMEQLQEAAGKNMKSLSQGV